MDDNKKIKKPATVSAFVVTLGLISYIVYDLELQVGNVFAGTEVPKLLYRFLPSLIVGFLVTFLIIKSSAKNMYKKDANNIKIASFIIPIVVVIVMAIFQKVWFEEQIQDITEEFQRTINLLGNSYKEMKEEYQVMLEENIRMARDGNRALIIYISLGYLFGGVLGAFLGTKNIEEKLLEDVSESLNNDFSDVHYNGLRAYPDMAYNPDGNLDPQEIGYDKNGYVSPQYMGGNTKSQNNPNPINNNPANNINWNI